MKNKFVLTEEESKRILTLHNKKIQEQTDGSALVSTNLGREVRKSQGQTSNKLNSGTKPNNSSTSYTLDSSEYFLESRDEDQPELKFFKGATFKIDGRGILKAKTKYQFVDTWSGEVFGFKDELMQVFNMPISKNKNLKYVNPETIDGTITYSCDQGKFFTDYNVDLLYYDDEGEITPPLRKLCETSKTGVSPTPTPSPTTSKCPSIVKSFTDAGYTQITLTRYKELSGDNTRIRKFKWCPVSKTNLYFAKPKVNQGGGGRPTGNRYGFNYQEALNALKSKGCKVSGGGSFEEDSFIDDWRTNQNQPQTVDMTVSKEDIQDWGS